MKLKLGTICRLDEYLGCESIITWKKIRVYQ